MHLSKVSRDVSIKKLTAFVNEDKTTKFRITRKHPEFKGGKETMTQTQGANLDWLECQQSGSFVVIHGVHAVVVDCVKKKVIDCLKSSHIDFNKSNLERCQISDSPNLMLYYITCKR